MVNLYRQLVHRENYFNVSMYVAYVSTAECACPQLVHKQVRDGSYQHNAYCIYILDGKSSVSW
jgi:hypothetical protein